MFSRNSPSKKGGGGGRGALLKSTVPKPQYPPLENRNCPVPGCDSVGHLSGKLDRYSRGPELVDSYQLLLNLSKN